MVNPKMDSGDMLGAHRIERLTVFAADNTKTFEIAREQQIFALVYFDGTVTIERAGHAMMLVSGCRHRNDVYLSECSLRDEPPSDGSLYLALRHIAGAADVAHGTCEVYLGVDPLPFKGDAVSVLNPQWGSW